MKRIVQRLALAFLLLLPMLANAQTITAVANHTARGTVTVKNAVSADYDTVVAVVKTGAQIVNDQSWYDNTNDVAITLPYTGVIGIENPTAGTYYLILDQTKDWDITVRFKPTTPTLTITDGAHLTASASPAGPYTYGNEITLTPSTDANFVFNGWVNTNDASDTISMANPYTFRITENTEITVGEKGASRTLTFMADYPGVKNECYFTINDGTTHYTAGQSVEIDHGTAVTIKRFDAVATTHFAPQGKWGIDADLDDTYETEQTVTNLTYTVESDVNIICYHTPSVTYTITAEGEENDDLGSVTRTPSQATYAYGDTVVLTAVPDDDNVFTNWTDGDYPNPRTIVVTDNATYIARFEFPKYSVSVTGEGFTFTIKDDQNNDVDLNNDVEWGSALTITATAPTGREFQKWSDNVTDNPRVLYVWGDTAIVAYVQPLKTITLTATPADKGTFKVDGENYDANAEYSVSTVHTILAVPAEGYSFTQWSDNSSTEPSRSITIVDGDNEYTAEFATGSYSVLAGPKTGGTGTVSGAGTYTYGANVSLTATAETDYHFVKWVDESDNFVSTANPLEFTMPAGNVTRVAVFAEDSTEITITVNDPAMGVATITTAEVTNGSSAYLPKIADLVKNYATLTATPNAGYQFDGWELTDHSSVTINTYPIPSVNTTLVAVFSAIDYTVTANTNDALMGSVTGVNNPYHVGDAVSLTAAPAEHHHLVKWNNGSNTTSISFTMPANDTTVTATFGIDSVTVTVASNDNNMGTVTISGETSDSRPYGSLVNTLVAATPASADYEFVKWQVASADIDIDSWTVPASAVTLTAIFQHVAVTVTTATDPAALTTTAIDPASPEYGDHIHMTYAPVDGYTFAGWTLEGDDNVIADSTNYEITATTTSLVAHFNINTYTITVATNDNAMGSVTIDGAASKVVEYNSNINALLDTVVNPGYTFVKWQANGVDVADIATWTVPAEDVALTAVFNYLPLSVTANVVDSAAAADFTSYTTTMGTPGSFTFSGNNIIGGIITTTAPAITGWHFWKWDDESGKPNPRKDTLTSNDPIVLNAIYAIDSFTLAITNNYGDAVSFTGAGRYAYGADATINFNIVNTDSLSFTNWGDANTDKPRVVAVVSDTTFVPVFGVIEYQVNATTDGNGTITAPAPATLPVDVAYGQTITITAEANHGYDFVNWTNDVDATTYDTPTITPTITEDVTWTANFAKTDFTVTTVVKDVAGNEQPTMGTIDGAGDYVFETSATLSYTANNGFTFVKWIGEGAGEEATTATITFPVNNDTTIIAQFDTLTTTVTAAADDPAHGDVTVSNASPKYYTQVTLTATENAGYQFKYWDDDHTITTKSRTIDVTFGATHNYTAVYEPRQYTVTVANTDGNGTVAITGTTENNVTVDFGDVVEIVATTNTGYTFDKWNNVETSATYSYTVAAMDTTFTATFTANTHDLTIQSSNFYRGGVRFGETGDSLETATQNGVEFNSTTHIEALPAYGYAFGSWSDDATAPAKRDYTFATDADVTLTANFVYAPYTIKVTLNDATLATIELNGTEVESGAETTFGYTDNVNVKVTPIANYHIVNGNTPYTNANPLTFNVDVLDNLEYNYTIVPDTFSVTINVNDVTKGHIENFTNSDFAYGYVITGVEAVADGSNTFANWSTGATTTTLPDVVVEKDTIITANFAINTYDFTVVSEDNTKGTVAGSQTDVDHGTDVTATATAADGYEFSNWTNENGTEVSTDNPYTFALTATTTLTAHFINETYKITANTFTPERGWISVTNGTDSYEDQTGNTLVVNGLPTHTDITVTATANTGYHFVNWDDDATAAATRTMQLTNDTVITANFAYDTYTVTWNVNVAGRGTIETLGTAAYHFGAVDTLKANPEAGYLFQKWEDGSTTNPRYYTVNGDATLTAIFVYDTTIDAIAECDSYVLGGHTYTVSETDTITLTDDYGFDSTVVVTITINHSSTEDVYADDCESYTWTAGDGLTYTSTQDVAYLVPGGNAAGCDSTVTLHLTIWGSTSGDTTATECVSFTWHGTTYDASTTDTYVYTDVNGCDSIVTLNLTINQPSAGIDVQEHCDSYEWQGTTYTESTNEPSVVLPGANQYGCDSTVTLNLTISKTDGELTEATQCDSYTWTLNNNVYTASGNYTYGHLNANGCFVVDTLALTVNHNTSTRFADVDVCDVYNQTWTDNTTEAITVSDEYIHTYTSVEGCPSADTISVVIRQSVNGTDVHHDICDTYTWNLNGETYTESNNTAVATLAGAAANGCDSIVTLDLTINHNSSTNFGEISGCDSMVFTWTDNTTEVFDGAATYTHEYETAAGCASVDTVTIVIRESNTGIDEQHACNTFTWIDGITYTESNDSAKYIVTNAAGCDSIVTLNLTVTYDQAVDVYDTACDSYVWNNLTFTTSRDVVLTSTDMYGCDSVTTLHLTINNSDVVEFADSAYGIYTWNGETYQANGAYQQTLTNANGCDSVVTLNLTILLPDNPYVYAEACVSYTWANTLMSDSSIAGNNMTYTESGTYNDTIRSTVSGGDSVINTLYLTIYQPVATTDAATACDSIVWNGNVYTVSGTYVDTLTTVNGCDSVVTMTLTINNTITTTATATACGSYAWNGNAYTVSGTYTDTLTAVSGCDSIVTMTLTINQPADSTITVSACDTYTWGTRSYSQSGTYTQIFEAANGCDSTVTMNLTINTGVNPDTIVAAACETYTWHGERTATGIYTYDTVDANGCAITETLNLTINTPVNTAESLTACDSAVWHGTTYTTSGTYSDTLTAANNCDSIVTLTLVINQHQDAAETIAACDSYTWNGQTYTASGAYTAAITDANGCAATATLNLTINAPVNTTESATECGSYTWQGTTYTTSGTYTAAITDANGCAATATLNLTINTPVNTTENATACDTYTWTVNNQSYTTSGAYTANITDANGCAATATLNLTVNTSVTESVALSDTGSVVFNNVTYTADTTFTLNLQTVAGCDSTVNVTITVIPEQQPEADSVMINITAGFPSHGTVIPSGYGFYHYGDVVTATATPDSGYVFSFWRIGYIDNNGTVDDTLYSNPLSFTVDSVAISYSVISIVAEFESISGAEDSLTIVMATADATMGTTVPAPGTYHVALGETFVATPMANDGYLFNHWEVSRMIDDSLFVDEYTDDTLSVGAYIYNIDLTYNITAYFMVDTTYVPDTVYHFVTLMSANAAMGTVSASDSVAEGENFTATAYPNEGYHFVSWNNGSEVLSTGNPYTFPVYADITLTAYFEADPVDTIYYTVTVNYDATMGTVTGEGRYEEGTVVTLRATANSGYHFVAWMNGSDVLASTTDYTFTVNADVTLTAQFEANTVYYTVTGLANDSDMGYVTGSGPYEEGATASLTAQAYEGYHFVNWSNGETTPTISFTVTGDVTYIAYFAPNDTPQGIDETDMSNVTIYSADSRIIVRGAEGMDVNVYDINGRTINSQVNAGEIIEFRMATTGVYLVKVGNAPAKRILVVR